MPGCAARHCTLFDAVPAVSVNVVMHLQTTLARCWYSMQLFHFYLQAANLDAYLSDIGIIFALDWFLDRCRSIPNVLGDAVTATIVHHQCKGSADMNSRMQQIGSVTATSQLEESLLTNDGNF